MSTKKNNYLTNNERHVLVDNYFYIHVSCLLNFDIDDVILFNSKYYFCNLCRTYIHTCIYIYIYIKVTIQVGEGNKRDVSRQSKVLI